MSEKELVLSVYPADGMTGRTKIKTHHSEITRENVVKVVSDALSVHAKNRREIQYLYDVYRNKQDIRTKEKIVRPEINNKVVVNIANQIVTFKSSFFLSAPPQYVSAAGDNKTSSDVERLNAYMRSEGKDSKDKQIVDWMHICGVGVRFVLPDARGKEEGSPANIITLDPRNAFVIYFGGVGEKSLAGVIRQKDDDGRWMSCVYTTNHYYEIKGNEIVRDAPSYLGRIPIIEYLNNEVRMGAFEVVMPILNAINTLQSNRIDNIVDFVNAFDVFQNCEIDEKSYKELTTGGKAIQIKTSAPGMEAKVYRITSELNQSGVQTIIDDLYESVLTVCGMPNRNGGSSTSDTGVATIFRDGWNDAESRAKDTEKLWEQAEREFLKIFLFISSVKSDLNLKPWDIKIEHTRNNLSNIQSRMQVLCEGLNNPKIHPKFPWIFAGIQNAEQWYRMSEEYAESQEKVPVVPQPTSNPGGESAEQAEKP